MPRSGSLVSFPAASQNGILDCLLPTVEKLHIPAVFHSYFKNLAIALAGKIDDYFTALWDHGHIKFWPYRTLSILLNKVGFTGVEFQRAGRFAPLAKSMIAVARKPRS